MIAYGAWKLPARSFPRLLVMKRQNLSMSVIRSTADRTVSASVRAPNAFLAWRSFCSSMKNDLRFSRTLFAMIASNLVQAQGHQNCLHTLSDFSAYNSRSVEGELICRTILRIGQRRSLTSIARDRCNATIPSLARRFHDSED